MLKLLFTAVQAAQKDFDVAIRYEKLFTAVQAAQKNDIYCKLTN